MKTATVLLVALIFLLNLLTTNGQNTVAIRVVYLSSNTIDTLNVFFNNMTIFSNIIPGNASYYREFDTNQNLTFQLITSANVEIQSPVLMGLTNNFYSIIAINELQEESSTVILDGWLPNNQDLSFAYVRFVHAAVGIPSLSVKSKGKNLFSNLTFSGVSKYISVPQEIVDMQVVDEREVVIYNMTRAFDAGRLYTLYAYGPFYNFEVISEFDEFALSNNLSCNGKRVEHPYDSGLRVINLISDMTIDVTLNESYIFPQLSYANATSYLALPSGSYDFLVFPGVNIANLSNPFVNVNLQNQMYSLVLFGYNGAFFSALFNDSNIQVTSENLSYVRFGHALLFAPSITLRVVRGPTLGDNIGYGQVSCYNKLRPGNYDLEVIYSLNAFGISRDITIARYDSISFSAGRVYTFYVHGSILSLSINGNIYLDYPNPVNCKDTASAVC